MLTRNQLEIAIEQDKTTNSFKNAAELLLEAVNDWPVLNLSEPEDLIKQLKNEINGDLNFDNIERYQKSLDLNHHAWKAESTTSLLLLLGFFNKEDNKMTLESALLKLKQHYGLNG